MNATKTKSVTENEQRENQPTTVNKEPALSSEVLLTKEETFNLQPSTLNLSVIDAKPLLPATPGDLVQSSIQNPGSSLQLAPLQNSKTPKLQNSITPALQHSVIAAQRRKYRRHGRVASLPKLQRDMVNRMLWNGVPYKTSLPPSTTPGSPL